MKKFLSIILNVAILMTLLSSSLIYANPTIYTNEINSNTLKRMLKENYELTKEIEDRLLAVGIYVRNKNNETELIPMIKVIGTNLGKSIGTTIGTGTGAIVGGAGGAAVGGTGGAAIGAVGGAIVGVIGGPVGMAGGAAIGAMAGGAAGTVIGGAAGSIAGGIKGFLHGKRLGKYLGEKLQDCYTYTSMTILSNGQTFLKYKSDLEIIAAKTYNIKFNGPTTDGQDPHKILYDFNKENHLQ